MLVCVYVCVCPCAGFEGVVLEGFMVDEMVQKGPE